MLASAGAIALTLIISPAAGEPAAPLQSQQKASACTPAGNGNRTTIPPASTTTSSAPTASSEFERLNDQAQRRDRQRDRNGNCLKDAHPQLRGSDLIRPVARSQSRDSHWLVGNFALACLLITGVISIILVWIYATND